MACCSEPCRRCGRTFEDHRNPDLPKACPAYERPTAGEQRARARAEELLEEAEQKLKDAGARPMTEAERKAAIRRENDKLRVEMGVKPRPPLPGYEPEPEDTEA